MADCANITADFARQVFQYDPCTGRIRRLLKSGSLSERQPDNQQRKGYRYVDFKRRKIAAHRLAWLLHYGEWPAGVLDHINRDRSDNRIANLRLATISENAHNASLRKDNTSGHRGVSWHAGKNAWQVRIRANGRHMWIGAYKDLAAAVAARNSAEKTHHPTKP